MSVLTIKKEDALPDPNLDIQIQEDWSRMRSANAGREILAYSVISDSGKMYEAELFISDEFSMCGFCSCPARLPCRHLKAVLADVLDRQPDFGKEAERNETQRRNRTDAEFG